MFFFENAIFWLRVELPHPRPKHPGNYYYVVICMLSKKNNSTKSSSKMFYKFASFCNALSSPYGKIFSIACACGLSLTYLSNEKFSMS